MKEERAFVLGLNLEKENVLVTSLDKKESWNALCVLIAKGFFKANKRAQ